jgi:C1A family cysteine protease
MTSEITKYKLSYKFQEKDERDYIYKTLEHPTNTALQLNIVVRPDAKFLKVNKISPTIFQISNLPPILDQGQLGACVPNSFSYIISKQTKSNLNISRLMLYALCRSIDNVPLDQDYGTTIRIACKAISNYGCCKESVFQYSNDNAFILPKLSIFKNSNLFKKFTYFFIKQDLMSIKSALVTYNTPIIFGIMVYESFMNATNGKIPVPNIVKEEFLGGHCITIVGYNDSTQIFTCSNNWSTNWGNKGYCSIPYAYILNSNLACDFCVTTFVY